MKKKIAFNLIVVLSFLFLMPSGVFCEEVVDIKKIDVSGGVKKTKKVKHVKLKGGLKKLINFSRSRKGMIEELNSETNSYRNVKEAIESGGIEKGMDAASVRERYGNPVIVLPDEIKGVEWVYKEGKESYFTGEKIYLRFGKDDKLSEWSEVKPAIK